MLLRLLLLRLLLPLLLLLLLMMMMMMMAVTAVSDSNLDAQAKRRTSIVVVKESSDLLEKMYNQSTGAASNKSPSAGRRTNAVNMAVALESPGLGSPAFGSGGNAAKARSKVADPTSAAAVAHMQASIAALQEQQAELLEASRTTQSQMSALQASIETSAKSLTSVASRNA